MKRIIIAGIICVLIIAMSLSILIGCNQRETVTHNVQVQADYFNVARRIVVLNMRTDKPIFELKGYFAIDDNSSNELVITCETDKGEYQVHYVYLNEWTMYVVEQLDTTLVDKYHYEVWYMPEAILPSVKPID